MTSSYPVLDVTDETTEQEVYDAIVAHLERQGGPSFSRFTSCCLNRGEEGQACAVACLMTDREAYAMPSWQGATRHARLGPDLRPGRLVRFERLLSGMQDAHDDSFDQPLGYINSRLLILARAHGLTPGQLSRWRGL